MKLEPCNLIERLVAETASSLIGGLQRFPEPIPFHCLWIDYVTIAVGAPLAVGLGTKHSHSLVAEFAALPIIVTGGNAQSIQDAISFIDRLDRFLRDVCIEEHAQMGDLLSRGWDLWSAYMSALPEIQTTTTQSLIGSSIAREASVLREKLRQQLPAPHRDFDIALRAAASADEHIVICAIASEEGASLTVAPSAVFEAARTGYVRWCRDFDASRDDTIAIPCTIGGLPWAILYKNMNNGDRIMALQLYRDVLPSRIEYLRIIAHRLYRTRLLDILNAAMLKTDGSIDSINRGWQNVGSVFPFRVPEILSTIHEGGDQEISRRGAVDWEIALRSNPFFPELDTSNSQQTWKDVEEQLPTLLRETLELRSQLTRAEALEQARALSHEIKNYTAPIITSLIAAVEATPSQEIIEALEGLRILNAASRAIFSGLSRETTRFVLRDFSSETDQFKELVELSLQLLLNHHAGSIKNFCHLDWSPRWSFDECRERLSFLLDTNRQDHFSRHPGQIADGPMVYFLAAMREMVQNIRVRHGERQKRISVTYEIELRDKGLLVVLRQQQLESQEPERDVELPAGMKMANSIFGSSEGIGLCDLKFEIEAHKICAPPTSSLAPIQESAFEVIRKSSAHFYL